MHIILGNNLAGDRVWPSGPALPIVTIEPSKSVKQDECATVFPGVFTACAVTRANSRLRVMDSLSANKRACPQIPSLPSTLERDDFILAQKEEDGLTELRDGVLSGEELQSADRGYLIHDGLLMRKFASLKDELIESLLQIVVPREYREKEDEEQTLFTAYDKVDQEWIESDFQFRQTKISVSLNWITLVCYYPEAIP